MIAKEGWSIIAVIALLAITSKVYLGIFPSLFFLLLLLLACFVFRNPFRNIPPVPLAVVSPASGKLIAIEETEDNWLSRVAVKFKVKISFWDVHALRSPVEGKIMDEWSSECDEPGTNRRYTYWIRTDEGDDVVFSLLLGRQAPYVRMLIHAGDRVGQGQYCGFLYCAGMVEVYMPENTVVETEAGKMIRSGSDILGHFVHGNETTAIGN